MVDVPNNPELADAIRTTAGNLGIDPVDLATTISYETGGTFDPTIKGPRTKWGQHIGLIQAGDVQRQEHGIDPQAPLPEQFAGIERYLRASGVKPGMGLLDVYSAINAGAPGRYGRSDAAAGGAPGTVEDKVRSMSAHAVRARALLGEPLTAGAPSGNVAAAAPAAGAPVPFGLSPAGVASPAAANTAPDEQAIAQVMEMMKKATAANEEDALPPALPPLRIGQLSLLGRARRRA